MAENTNTTTGPVENGPNQTANPWTQAKYNEAAPFVRHSIREHIDHMLNTQPPEPGATHGDIESRNRVVALFSQALNSEDSVAVLSAWALGWAMWQEGLRMDDGAIRTDGPRDPEVNVEKTRGAKFRVVEAIEKELGRLTNKEAENLVYYLQGISTWMEDGFYAVRNYSGYGEEGRYQDAERD